MSSHLDGLLGGEEREEPGRPPSDHLSDAHDQAVLERRQLEERGLDALPTDHCGRPLKVEADEWLGGGKEGGVRMGG